MRRVRYINKEKYERKTETISYRPVGILVIALVIFLLVQLLTLSVVGTKGAELAKIREEKKTTEENIRQLKAEISFATSLERIEQVATNKLGMKKVEKVKYIDGDEYVSARVE